MLVAPLLPAAAAAVLYGLGSMICHQRPERAFHLAGSQLPVCARCTGIYAGAALGAFVSLGRIERLRRAARWWMSAAAAPAAATLAAEWSGMGDPGNTVRAMSGVIVGAGVAAVVRTVHYGECARTRPIVPSPPLTLT